LQKHVHRGKVVLPLSVCVFLLIKTTPFSAGGGVTFDEDVENLLCLAIEMRMMHLLKRLGTVTHAAEDVGRFGVEYGPVHETSNPMAILKRAAAVEETAQSKKAKQERDEVIALMESNREDARVRLMIDEQARQRAAAASSEAALAFARARYVIVCIGNHVCSVFFLSHVCICRSSSSTSNSTSGATKRPPPPIEDPPEVRIARARVLEEQDNLEDSKLIHDYDRRIAALQRGQSALHKARGVNLEKRVGLKVNASGAQLLLFVC
jgi:hypothetical protein